MFQTERQVSKCREPVSGTCKHYFQYGHSGIPALGIPYDWSILTVHVNRVNSLTQRKNLLLSTFWNFKFCHFDMRKGFSVRWRTVIFVKMLTGFSLLSSYRFSLARFLIAWPLFSLVSTDRAAWHRLIYTIQLLFWDRMAVKNCFSSQYWTRWWSFSLKRLHVCTVPTSSLSSGIYLLTISFFTSSVTEKSNCTSRTKNSKREGWWIPYTTLVLYSK